MQDPANWNGVTAGGVKFELLTASGLPEIFDTEQPTSNQATADFICLWADRDAVVEFLLGGGVNGPPPQTHPVRTDLIARRVVISGMNGQGFDGTWAAFKYAKLNVTYRLLAAGGGLIGDVTAIISVSSESAGEYMTIPGRNLAWAAGPSNGKPLSEPQQKYIPKKIHKVTVHQWYGPPFAAMDVAQGNINSAGVSWIGRTIAAECLLFESYNESFDITRYGITPFKVEMTFIEKMRSWNKFVASDSLFYYITPEPFQQSSFAGIFP